ncbi:MAG: hypothetical protein K6D03_00730 [Solobacterium sp.]|nr:hypothetical protein [Solobacterium sp.]
MAEENEVYEEGWKNALPGLLELGADGNYEALKTITEHYSSSLVKYAMTMTEDRSTAKKCAINAFAAALKQPDKFNDAEHFEDWLKSLVKGEAEKLKPKEEDTIVVDDLLSVINRQKQTEEPAAPVMPELKSEEHEEPEEPAEPAEKESVMEQEYVTPVIHEAPAAAPVPSAVPSQKLSSTLFDDEEEDEERVVRRRREEKKKGLKSLLFEDPDEDDEEEEEVRPAGRPVRTEEVKPEVKKEAESDIEEERPARRKSRPVREKPAKKSLKSLLFEEVEEDEDEEEERPARRPSRSREEKPEKKGLKSLLFEEVDDDEEEEKPVRKPRREKKAEEPVREEKPAKKGLKALLFEETDDDEEEEVLKPAKKERPSRNVRRAADDEDDDDDEGTPKWLIILIVLLILAVLGFAGYFLKTSGIFSGGSSNRPAQTAEVTPVPSASPTASITPETTPTPEAAPTVEPTPETGGKIGTVTINVTGLNSRKKPTTAADKLAQVTAGSTYDVYETTKAEGYTWYRIDENRWIADNGSWVTYKAN